MDEMNMDVIQLGWLKSGRLCLGDSKRYKWSFKRDCTNGFVYKGMTQGCKRSVFARKYKDISQGQWVGVYSKDTLRIVFYGWIENTEYNAGCI